MVLMGYQIHSNKCTCIPHQYHCQLNSKCLSWEWFLWPVGTGLYTELKKLVPYGASRYSSNQASFQEPDPFQWESEWCLDLPESYSNQSLTELHCTGFCFWHYPTHIRDAALCITALSFHLKHSIILWPKEDSSHTGLCSWICYLRQAERTLPLFQIPQQGQKSFTVSCF